MQRTAAECGGMLWNEVALFCYIDIGVVTLFCYHIGSFAASFSREVRLCGPVRVDLRAGSVFVKRLAIFLVVSGFSPFDSTRSPSNESLDRTALTTRRV